MTTSLLHLAGLLALLPVYLGSCMFLRHPFTAAYEDEVRRFLGR